MTFPLRSRVLCILSIFLVCAFINHLQKIIQSSNEGQYPFIWNMKEGKTAVSKREHFWINQSATVESVLQSRLTKSPAHTYESNFSSSACNFRKYLLHRPLNSSDSDRCSFVLDSRPPAHRVNCTNAVNTFGRCPTSTEITIFMKHYLAWREAVSFNDDSQILVMENHRLLHPLQSVLEEAQKYDIVFLESMDLDNDFFDE